MAGHSPQDHRYTTPYLVNGLGGPGIGVGATGQVSQFFQDLAAGLDSSRS